MDQAAYVYHQGVTGQPIEEFTWARKGIVRVLTLLFIFY